MAMVSSGIGQWLRGGDADKWKEPTVSAGSRLRYTTRSCVIAPPRWWRAWNYSRAHHLLSLAGMLADRSGRHNADHRRQRHDCRWRRRGSAALAIGHRLVLEERERSVEGRVLLRRRVLGASRVDVRLDAVRRDAVVLGREPAADRDPHPTVVLELAPDLDRVLAEGRLAHQRGAPALLQRGRHDFRGGGGSAVDEHGDRQIGVGGDAVAERLVTLHALVGRLLGEDQAVRDELAGDLLCGVDV